MAASTSVARTPPCTGAPAALRSSSRTGTRSFTHPSPAASTSMPRYLQNRLARARSRTPARTSSATPRRSRHHAVGAVALPRLARPPRRRPEAAAAGGLDVADAIAGGVGDGRLLDVDTKLEDGTNAPAVLAIAAGVGAKLVVLEGEREARLGHLHAAELDATGRLTLAGCLPAVAGDGGAAA